MRKNGFKEAQGQFDADLDNYTGDGDEAVGKLQPSSPTSGMWRGSSLEPVSIQVEMIGTPGPRRLCKYLNRSNQSS